MDARRLKASVLISAIVTSGLTLIAWTQTWFVATIAANDVSATSVPVGGDVAAGALAALGLAGLALVGALAIAGPVFRLILGALEALIGATVALSVVLALADPVDASSAIVTEATGVSGAESVARLVQSVESTFWPWLALALGAASVILGGTILVTGRRWPGSTRKYQAVRFEPDELGGSPGPVPGTTDAVEDWDALSDGSDPTFR